MQSLCAASGGMERGELLREALAVFGGRRMTPKVSQRMDAAHQFALRQGLVHQVGDHLRAGSPD